MSARPDLPVLHLLNTVFAGVTGCDLYLAGQIQAGIEQALADGGPADFAAAIQAVQQRLGGEAGRHGFFHWDAAHATAAPDSLWSRQQVLDGLKSLAPYAEATLLVTGLRSALCPRGRRWTERRRAAYRDVVDFLDELARLRKRHSARLQVFVL